MTFGGRVQASLSVSVDVLGCGHFLSAGERCQFEWFLSLLRTVILSREFCLLRFPWEIGSGLPVPGWRCGTAMTGSLCCRKLLVLCLLKSPISSIRLWMLFTVSGLKPVGAVVFRPGGLYARGDEEQECNSSRFSRLSLRRLFQKCDITLTRSTGPFQRRTGGASSTAPD